MKHTSQVIRYIIIGLAFTVSFNAKAALFDFENYADVNGEAGYSAFSMTDGGITVTATADSDDPDGESFAYLDKGDAGLGVCKDINSSNQCVPGGDDNLTAGEELILTFSEAVHITLTFFRNALHGTNFDPSDDFEVSIDGGDFTSYSLISNFATVLTGTVFSFVVDDVDDDGSNGIDDGDQLYIAAITATAVPEPASMMIMGLGLLGMGFGLARRRKLS